MFDIEASFDKFILESAKSKPTIVFVEPKDPRIIEAAVGITRYARPVLLASEAEVREIIARELPDPGSQPVEYGLSETVVRGHPLPARSGGRISPGLYLDYAAGAGEPVSLRRPAPWFGTRSTSESAR
jgi:hypothetical protein